MDNCIVLGDSLEISALAPLRSEWLSKLGSEATEIVVEADKLTRADTAAIQMLQALKNSAVALGKAFSIQGASPALCSQAAILGLSSSLGLPAESLAE